MSNDVRIVKFKRIVKKIWEDLDHTLLTMDNKAASKDDSIYLATIYDYDTLNDYGKVIMEQVSDLENNGDYLPFYKETEYRIDQLDWIIQSIELNLDHVNLKFIFWALMILAVDDTDKEEHLSLICDFAKLKRIKDSVMLDIVQIVRLVFGKEITESLGISSVRVCFERLLKDYHYQDKPISSVKEGVELVEKTLGGLFLDE